MGQTTAERQRAYRERQKALGRKARTFIVTDDEAFYIERLIEAMHDGDLVPAVMRERKTGRFRHLDT